MGSPSTAQRAASGGASQLQEVPMQQQGPSTIKTKLINKLYIYKNNQTVGLKVFNTISEHSLSSVIHKTLFKDEYSLLSDV